MMKSEGIVSASTAPGKPRPADFAARLVAWQKQHGRRDLPWQASRDPYRIWLSEIMLQQTQVASVIPYYRRFLARFPDLAALAAAPLDEVMALWSGLGYYARARHLHAAARQLVGAHGGRFPRSVPEITKLPGVGRSTAAAIAAFAWGQRAAILDGNVRRVLCRAFGIEGFPGERVVEQRLWQLAERLLPEHDIETYTQALMDLGASVCTRSRPGCARCPLHDDCVAKASGRTGELPAPRPRRARPLRRCAVFILLDGERVLLERRPPAGIWGGLLSLPEAHELPAGAQAELAARFGLRVDRLEALPPLRHGFTHFELELRPWLGRVASTGGALHAPCGEWHELAALAGAGLPAPIRKLLAAV